MQLYSDLRTLVIACIEAQSIGIVQKPQYVVEYHNRDSCLALERNSNVNFPQITGDSRYYPSL
jgi:hypothetical protein